MYKKNDDKNFAMKEDKTDGNKVYNAQESLKRLAELKKQKMQSSEQSINRNLKNWLTDIKESPKLEKFKNKDFEK